MTQEEGEELILPTEIASWDRAQSEKKEWRLELVGEIENIQQRDLTSQISLLSQFLHRKKNSHSLPKQLTTYKVCGS